MDSCVLDMQSLYKKMRNILQICHNREKTRFCKNSFAKGSKEDKTLYIYSVYSISIEDPL